MQRFARTVDCLDQAVSTKSSVLAFVYGTHVDHDDVWFWIQCRWLQAATESGVDSNVMVEFWEHPERGLLNVTAHQGAKQVELSVDSESSADTSAYSNVAWVKSLVRLPKRDLLPSRDVVIHLSPPGTSSRLQLSLPADAVDLLLRAELGDPDAMLTRGED